MTYQLTSFENTITEVKKDKTTEIPQPVNFKKSINYINQHGLEIQQKQRKSGRWLVELVKNGRVYYRAVSSKSAENAFRIILGQLALD
jgi:hypothetical protein